jgi:hypothetical protein
MTLEQWLRSRFYKDNHPKYHKYFNKQIYNDINGILKDENMEQFISSILKGIKPLDSEFQKFIDDNFWDLI